MPDCHVALEDLEVANGNITIDWTITGCRLTAETILTIQVCSNDLISSKNYTYPENTTYGRIVFHEDMCGSLCIIWLNIMINNMIANKHDPCIPLCPSVYKCNSRNGTVLLLFITCL